ncbi:MAG: nuclear transport factor 2 family protein [Pirellulales bacterium]
MSRHELEAFVGRWLAAWTGNKPERLLGFYAQDATYRDPARPAGLQGHEQLRPYFVRLLGANPQWVWEPLEVAPTPRGCCLKWKATVPQPSGTIEWVGLDLVEIDGGLITRNEVYFDPQPRG